LEITKFDFSKEFFRILQYPGKHGLYDYADFIKKADNEIMAVAADILSLVKLTPR
jgi:glycine cleavage system pyridoxal-binding protein P